MREEHKFLLKRGRELPGPNKLVKGLGTYSVTRRHQEAVYYDTADLRLTRAGASLRFRSDDGWTVKLPEHHHGLLERDEIVFGFLDAAEPPREAVALVQRVSVRSLGQGRHGHDRPPGDPDRRPARTAGRVDRRRSGPSQSGANRIDVVPRGRVRGRVRCRRRAGRRGRRTVAQGRQKVDGQRPKVARRFGEPARGTPMWSPVIDSAVSARRATSVRTTLANGLYRLVTHDPVVRTDDDPEGVHQAHVGTRRLRSDLRTLRPCSPRVWTDPLRDRVEVARRAAG